MEEKPIVSVTYENERISIKKNSLPYLKCVVRLSCAVHGPIYGRFMGFNVKGFLSIRKRFTVYWVWVSRKMGVRWVSAWVSRELRERTSV